MPPSKACFCFTRSDANSLAFMRTALGDRAAATERRTSQNQSQRPSRTKAPLKGRPWRRRMRFNKCSGVLLKRCGGWPPRLPATLKACDKSARLLANRLAPASHCLSFLGGAPGYTRVKSKKS